MQLINLGCGNNHHPGWINVDFVSTCKDVIAHNLLFGIPFKDDSFDVVYNSHLLEHFPKKEAILFLKECFRVLKSGGIIRIAVPDLESIAKEYLSNLNRVINNEHYAEFDYDWIMLEMYDQIIRNTSGGEMAKYLFRKEIPNWEYVYNRIGNEGKSLHENYLNSIKNKTEIKKKSILLSIKYQVIKLCQFPKFVLMRTLFKKEYEVLKNELEALEVGRFRLSGEVHQWMYDRYSLGKLLDACGFKNIRIVSAFESDIKDWDKYQLDSKDGIVRKPDSLFMEAIK